MKTTKCPYCGDAIAEDATKCMHCNERIKNGTPNSQTNVDNRHPAIKEAGDKHQWVNIACVLAIFFEVVSFFQYLGSSLDLDNVSKYGKLARYINFSNLIPEWVVSLAIFGATIYLWVTLRKQFIAKKTIFTQYIFLVIISTSILLANLVFGNDNFNPSNTLMRWSAILMIYEIIIGVKILRNYTNTLLLGISFIICPVVIFFATGISLSAQNLTTEEDIIFTAIGSGATIIWLLMIKYYFKNAQVVAEPSNLKTSIANQKSVNGSNEKGIISWIVFGFCVVSVLVISLFTGNNSERVNNNSTPKIINEFEIWVAEKSMKDCEKQAIYANYIDEQFDKTSFKYQGDYSEDESGDSQWGETKAYLALANVVLSKISIYSREAIIARDDIRKSINDLVNYKKSRDRSLYYYLINNNGYHESGAEYYISLMAENPYTPYNVLDLFGNLKELYSAFSSLVEVIEWEVESESDNSTILLVAYKVNDIYVLCRILERDNGYSEIKIVSKSTSLLDLYE